MNISPYKLFFGLALIVLVSAMIYLTSVLEWRLLISYIVTINILTIVFYLYDKVVSPMENILRVPERILHTLALVGGSPAALLSQKLFRHKTSKGGFQVWFWLIVLAQVGMIIYFYYRQHIS